MIYEIIIYCEVLGIEYATFCLYYYSNRRRVPVFPLLYIIGKNAKNLVTCSHHLYKWSLLAQGFF